LFLKFGLLVSNHEQIHKTPDRNGKQIFDKFCSCNPVYITYQQGNISALIQIQGIVFICNHFLLSEENKKGLPYLETLYLLCFTSWSVWEAG